MKTLKNHLILFDAECPMCNLYTGAFVRSGLLDANGREAYQQYSGQSCPNLDWQRAVNEIALVNQQTGEVTYGVESLLRVCANAWPPVATLFRWKISRWLAQKAYAFISYNRRVIVPASERGFRFQPAFTIHYRIAWLLFTWVVTSAILANYTQLLTGVVPPGAFWREFAVCGGQIIFQGIIVAIFQKNKTWDYLGNMMTISLMGAVALFILLTISSWLHLGIWFYAFGFLMVAFLMFLEHLRRTSLLGIRLLMTITWVLYRVIILLILLWPWI